MFDRYRATFVWRITMSEISYIAGLDLGQATASPALAILERTQTTAWTDPSVMTFRVRPHWSGLDTVAVREAAPKKQKTFAVRHLERFPLGTTYPAICDRLVEL